MASPFHQLRDYGKPLSLSKVGSELHLNQEGHQVWLTELWGELEETPTSAQLWTQYPTCKQGWIYGNLRLRFLRGAEVSLQPYQGVSTYIDISIYLWARSIYPK